MSFSPFNSNNKQLCFLIPLSIEFSILSLSLSFSSLFLSLFLSLALCLEIQSDSTIKMMLLKRTQHVSSLVGPSCQSLWWFLQWMDRNGMMKVDKKGIDERDERNERDERFASSDVLVTCHVSTIFHYSLLGTFFPSHHPFANQFSTWVLFVLKRTFAFFSTIHHLTLYHSLTFSLSLTQSLSLFALFVSLMT